MKKILFPLVALTLGLAATLVVAEIVLGFFEGRTRIDAHASENLDLLMPNPNGTGSYRLKPNLDIVTRVGRYRVPIRTNQFGMRWRDVSPERGDRRRRIGFLGDSFTFGCWSDSVERSLAGVFETSVSPDRWEVLNFGVGGYGFSDIELLITEEAIRFDLSYAILVSFNGNDFRDAYLGLHKDRIIDGAAVLDDDVLKAKVPGEAIASDRTTSQPSYETSSVSRTMRRSAVFRLIAPFLNLEHLAIDFKFSRRFLAYSYWSQVPYPPVAEKAKDESLTILLRIRNFLAERGVLLAVAALPTREQVYSRVPYGPGFDINFPQAYVRLFARENGIPFLDLLPIFREHVSRTNENLYVKGDTHLNNEGHALAGWHLSEWFRCCVKTVGP